MSILGATLYYLGCAILACTLYAWLMHRHNARDLRCLVWQNLDSADEGGQFDSNGVHAGYLHGMTAAEVANDMTLYCDDVCAYDAAEVLPHVQAWMASRGIAA